MLSGFHHKINVFLDSRRVRFVTEGTWLIVVK